MHGPDVTWYVDPRRMLFVDRHARRRSARSPLIILLSRRDHAQRLRTCALIAFARQHGREDGQVFAIAVMAIAASEVVVGLGLIVAMGRRHVELDVDKLRTLADDDATPPPGSASLLPLAATLAITLAGTGISRRAAGYLSTATTIVSFARRDRRARRDARRVARRPRRTRRPRGRGSRPASTASA